MARVVVFVEGGVVVSTIADTDGVEMLIVDYDNEKEGDQRGTFSTVENNPELVARTVAGKEMED